MNSMFYAYDNDLDLDFDPSLDPCSQKKALSDTPKMLYTKSGKFIGIQIKYQAATCLYFNLSEICNKPDLIEFISNSLIKFKINTLSHKVAFEKTFKGYEILNSITGDLQITLTSQEVASLRRESYRLELLLLNEDNTQVLFNNLDTYLVIR